MGTLYPSTVRSTGWLVNEARMTRAFTVLVIDASATGRAVRYTQSGSRRRKPA